MKKSLYILLPVLVILLAINSCSKPTKTAEGYWESGSALFDVENYDRAIDEFQNIINYYPDSEEALKAVFFIAEIYKNNIKDYEKAIEKYRQIEKNYPDSDKAPNALFMIGYIYANEMENYNEAKKAYQHFIKTYPGHGLVSSAEWEIENMGKTLEELQDANITD